MKIRFVDKKNIMWMKRICMLFTMTHGIPICIEELNHTIDSSSTCHFLNREPIDLYINNTIYIPPSPYNLTIVNIYRSANKDYVFMGIDSDAGRELDCSIFQAVSGNTVANISNTNPETCMVSWNNLEPSTAFMYLYVPSGTLQYIRLLIVEVSPTNIPISPKLPYILGAFTLKAVDSTILSVRITLKAYQSCISAPTNVQLVFFDDSKEICREPLTSDELLQYSTNISISELEKCQSNEQYFVRLVMDSDCVTVSTILLPSTDMIQFRVQRDSNIIVSTTDIQVVSTYLDPIFDPYEPSFTLESNNCSESLLYPTAVIRVRQKFKYGGAGAIPIAGKTAVLDHTILYLQSIDCDSNETCEVEYSSSECILCSLNRTGYFQMNARMELPDKVFTEPVESPAFLLKGAISLSMCTEPGKVEDLTLDTNGRAEFPVEPTVDGIILAVSAKSDLAVIIESILAEDLLSGSSALITIANKEKMMREPLSNYFSDVHFCRHETVLNGCSVPFYFGQNTAGTIMETVPSSTLNTVWQVPGKGYFQCQDVNNDRNTDRIILNPSTWFTPVNGMYSFKLTVTARLSTCAPIKNRRVLSSPSQIIKTVTQVNLNYSTDTRSSSSKETLAIGLGVGIPLSVLFFTGAGFYLSRSRSTRHGMVIPEWS